MTVADGEAVDRQALITAGLRGVSFPATDVIQVHTYSLDNSNWRTFLKNGLPKALNFAKGFGKPVLLGEFAVRTDNPNRNEIIKATYQAAKEHDVPAMIWTHRYDQFGDLNNDILKIYRDIHFTGDML